MQSRVTILWFWMFLFFFLFYLFICFFFLRATSTGHSQLSKTSTEIETEKNIKVNRGALNDVMHYPTPDSYEQTWPVTALRCSSRAPAGAVRAGRCASTAPEATAFSADPHQCRWCRRGAGQLGRESSADCASYAGCARSDALPDPPTSTWTRG